MAKAKNKGSKKAPKVQKAEPLGLLWTAVAAIATGAAIGLFVCAAFPDWRVAQQTTIHYDSGIIKTELQNQLYNPTKFGLYSISFNGGVTNEAWYRKSSRICSGIDILAPYSQGTGMFLNSPCPPICVSHFRTRCSVYNKMTFAGYLGLGSCIIVGMLVIVGVAWLVVFGRSNILLQVLWLGGGLINICILVWWIYESDLGFNQLGIDSQYPYPSVGPACSGAFICSAILILLGLGIMFFACLEDSAFWKARQLDVDQAIIGDQAATFNSPFAPFAASSARPPPMSPIGPPTGGVGQAMGLSSPGAGGGNFQRPGQGMQRPPPSPMGFQGTSPARPLTPPGALPGGLAGFPPVGRQGPSRR